MSEPVDIGPEFIEIPDAAELGFASLVYNPEFLLPEPRTNIIKHLLWYAIRIEGSEDHFKESLAVNSTKLAHRKEGPITPILDQEVRSGMRWLIQDGLFSQRKRYFYSGSATSGISESEWHCPIPIDLQRFR